LTVRQIQVIGADVKVAHLLIDNPQPKDPVVADAVQQNLSLRAIEWEVVAEGREGMRGRLKECLQQQTDRDDAVFPPQRAAGAASAQEGVSADHRRGGG